MKAANTCVKFGSVRRRLTRTIFHVVGDEENWRNKTFRLLLHRIIKRKPRRMLGCVGVCRREGVKSFHGRELLSKRNFRKIRTKSTSEFKPSTTFRNRVKQEQRKKLKLIVGCCKAFYFILFCYCKTYRL